MVLDPEFFQSHFCCRTIATPLSLREMFSPAGNSLASADCADEQKFFGKASNLQISECSSFAQPSRSGGCQFLISNRRTVDHGPETPPLLALTRHHILSVGSVLVLN